MRISCASPRASLRSVFTVIARQRRLHMPRLKQNGIESCWLQTSLQPLRQWPRRVRWFKHLARPLYVVVPLKFLSALGRRHLANSPPGLAWV